MARVREGPVSIPRSSVGSRTGADCPAGSAYPLLPVSFGSASLAEPQVGFQPPPRQTQRAVFPHWAFLLASCQSLWDLSCWLSFRSRPTNPVCVKQPEFAIQPWPTPPLPAEAFPLPRPHQMPPNLLFYPVFDKRKAPARMSHRKIVHPSPQDRVDLFDDPTHL